MPGKVKGAGHSDEMMHIMLQPSEMFSGWSVQVRGENVPKRPMRLLMPQKQRASNDLRRNRSAIASVKSEVSQIYTPALVS